MSLRRFGRGALWAWPGAAAVAVLATTLPPPTSTPTPTRGAALSLEAAARQHPDLDGDGRVDVILGASRTLAIVDGRGNRSTVPAPAGTDPINTVFGVATATGDFNDDGYDDVAAADSWFDSTAGGVWVFAGGPHGTLVGDGTIATVLLQQGADGMPGTADSQMFFGHSLAAGDLTGDGVDDLVVGTMFDQVGDVELAGTVTVVPGSASGPAPARGRQLSQSTPGIPGVPEYNDKFGAAVAIGDVTGDDRLDLVVGSSGEDSDGMVQLLPGAPGGPTGKGATSVTAHGLGIRAGTGSVAEFAATVAVGDLTGDGRDDVVAGAHAAMVKKVICGALAVVRGHGAGLSRKRAQVVSQSTRDVVGICERNDAWADSLTVGDLTGDGRPELVVGAPVESVGTLNGGGSYTVLRRTSTGVTGKGSFAVDQNTPRIPGVAELGDTFGQSLALADLNRDGRLDVLAGADGEVVGATRAGSVTFVISTATGRPAATTSSLTGQSFSPAVLRLSRSISAPAAVGP